jgi:2,3-bisphosphoglycerate-dependent phosphoglycerate mutase
LRLERWQSSLTSARPLSQRAIRSTWIILQEMNTVYLPVYKSWRLNERMYGALQGLSKVEMAATFGVEQVQQWRGGYRSRPPALTPASPHWPGHDRKHFDLDPSQIPLTEVRPPPYAILDMCAEQHIQHYCVEK